MLAARCVVHAGATAGAVRCVTVFYPLDQGGYLTSRRSILACYSAACRSGARRQLGARCLRVYCRWPSAACRLPWRAFIGSAGFIARG